MKKTGEKNNGPGDVPEITLEEQTGLSPSEAARERWAVQDEALDNVDREKIDEIILSNDVQKGGKIRIERRGPMDQKFYYLCTVPPEGWNTEDMIERCKLKFGGGDYQCRTFRANGQMYKMFNFSIDPRFKGQLDEEEIKRLAADGGLKSGDMTTRLLDMVQAPRGDGIKMTEIMGLMDRATGKSDSTMAMMMTMMMKSQETQSQNFTAMITALATMFAGKGGQDNQTILMELIKQKQDRPPMSETLEMMRQIKDIFEKEPDDKEETMWEKVGKLLAPVAERMVGFTPAIPGQPQAQVRTPPKPQGLVAMMPAEYAVLFKMGLKAARQNSDPALYLDLMVDQMDEQSFQMVKQTLTPDDWCVKLFGDEAQVADIRPWLDELRRLILAYEPDSPIAAGPGSPDRTPAGPAGPDANPPDHGGGG